jgi:hypothetical protein
MIDFGKVQADAVKNIYKSKITGRAAWQVAAMMMLMKNARIKSSRGKDKDSWIDAAGYSACGGELVFGGEERGEKNNGR